jgi:hypothetical protein
MTGFSNECIITRCLIKLLPFFLFAACASTLIEDRLFVEGEHIEHSFEGILDYDYYEPRPDTLHLR